MNNIRKYTAWLGAGAIMITLATGCADKNNNGVPDAGANVADAIGNTASNMTDAAGNTASNMADGAGNMADAAGNTMDNASGAMANGANTAMDATGNVASAAGTNMAQGAQSVGGAIANAGDAATYTPKIKTALGAQPALKGSKIDVDTIGAKKTIALRGTVTSEAQKKMAEAIAKKNGPTDFKVDNQLKMGGKM